MSRWQSRPSLCCLQTWLYQLCSTMQVSHLHISHFTEYWSQWALLGKQPALKYRKFMKKTTLNHQQNAILQYHLVWAVFTVTLFQPWKCWMKELRDIANATVHGTCWHHSAISWDRDDENYKYSIDAIPRHHKIWYRFDFSSDGSWWIEAVIEAKIVVFSQVFISMLAINGVGFLCRTCTNSPQGNLMLAAAIFLFLALLIFLFCFDFGGDLKPGVMTKVKTLLSHFQVLFWIWNTSPCTLVIVIPYTWSAKLKTIKCCCTEHSVVFIQEHEDC